MLQNITMQEYILPMLYNAVSLSGPNTTIESM